MAVPGCCTPRAVIHPRNKKIPGKRGLGSNGGSYQIRGLWLDVDHLDLAVVVLLEHFQDFEVVAFDEHVLGSVPVKRIVLVWHERCSGRGLCGADGVALSWPGESESLWCIVRVFTEK